jgi:hypothetical protein
MADRFGWVPIPAEVHTFQAEVGGGKQIVTGAKTNYRAVVANSGHQPAIFWRLSATRRVALASSGGRPDF